MTDDDDLRTRIIATLHAWNYSDTAFTVFVLVVFIALGVLIGLAA